MNHIIAPLLFLPISFVFSMLGMGGSQLYIPVLFWLGMDFKTQAIPLGMLLNVINSSSATYTYARDKLVDWKVALPFGITMVLFVPLGTWVNMRLPTKAIILIFALFTAASALLMLSEEKSTAKKLSDRKSKILGLVGGSLLGFFAGLIGRAGGSFVVPLLYMAGLEEKVAAATSAVVVTFAGASGFISHLFTIAHPEWTTWLLSIIAVIIGSQLGSNIMATQLKPKNIKIIFSTVLLLISLTLILQIMYM